MKTRKELQEKGQFWTPAWIAENMVRYVLTSKVSQIFDPAYGMGAFFVATKKISKRKNISFYGTDIDDALISEIKNKGILSKKEVKNLQTNDFILTEPERKYDAIVANPPYLRHHRISSSTKIYLKKISERYLGKALDGRAGLHIYFLILSLLSLKENGRMSFIVSSDICEGVFSSVLWEWISQNYCIEAVLTFNGDATPFPNIDTNPIILFIKNARPQKQLSWARCLKEDQQEISKWIGSNFSNRGSNGGKLLIFTRNLNEALKTGLSRFPNTEVTEFTLGDFASAMRGIATGNNKFFLLTKEFNEKLKIPTSYLVPAIGRTRDVKTDVISKATLIELDKKGRPYLLLYIDKGDVGGLPQSLKKYIAYGEKNNFHKTPLIASRNPWFKMERRDPPPILFAYLGRRNSRFIFNEAKVLPLNGFLCIYPKKNNALEISRLIKLFNHKDVLKNLFLVGKSYGSDAVKVEPRAIERLPIPRHLVEELGLKK